MAFKMCFKIIFNEGFTLLFFFFFPPRPKKEAVDGGNFSSENTALYS